jgi:hypothetical protein
MDKNKKFEQTNIAEEISNIYMSNVPAQQNSPESVGLVNDNMGDLHFVTRTYQAQHLNPAYTATVQVAVYLKLILSIDSLQPQVSGRVQYKCITQVHQPKNKVHGS